MNVSIVLVEPEHAGNLGAVARAMNNMGFTQLRLVNPCDFRKNTHDGAYALAVHSQSILDDARIFSSLREAVADQQFIIGTTARVRAEHQTMNGVWNLADCLQKHSGQKIAFVFGRESTGLTNAEADLCNLWMSIPTFGSNRSLNLAQAVMVVLYEASKYFFADKNQITLPAAQSALASSQEIENLKSHLFILLERIGFLKPDNRDTKWSLFSDILATKSLSSKEVSIMRGFLSRVEGAIDVKEMR